ncbi:zinc finger protein 610-like [Anopheles darlingi]|uniref:zinc finger protein 610-like n=1 Tax=Anopheles darlingi TaxID=43151 RepID=UPI0021002368|nr:zinc finger protein 610-like [Anopheles darlingi]
MDSPYCRVCLAHKRAKFVSINEYIRTTETLYTVLYRLCPTAFKEKDNARWSAVVCIPCKRQIIIAQDLYDLSIRSTERLEQLDLAESKKLKNEDSSEDEFDKFFFNSPEDAASSLPAEHPLDEPTNDLKKNAATEEDDEFDPEFFGTSEDDLVDRSNENTAAKACLGSVDIGEESIALVNLEYLLGAAKQKPTTSSTMDSSSVLDCAISAVDDSLNSYSDNETKLRDTSSIGQNIPSSTVVENTETTDTADVEMYSPDDTGFSSEESEDEIAKIFKEKTYHCWDRCGMFFYDKPSFDNHLMDHKMRRRWFCKFCFQGFDKQEKLSEHLPSHDGSLLCAICGEIADSPEQNNHDHSKTGPFDCPKCPRRFETQHTFSNHLKRHGAKEFCCEVCGVYLSSRKRLLNHKMAKHSGEKPFSCEVCGHKFALKDRIKSHMKTHTGEKPYGCMFCDRRYGSSGDLKDHLRKHLGENIYQCDQCDASFRLIKELKNHYEQTHYRDDAGASTSERPPDFRFTLNYLVNMRRQKELDKLYTTDTNSPHQE